MWWSKKKQTVINVFVLKIVIFEQTKMHMKSINFTKTSLILLQLVLILVFSSCDDLLNKRNLIKTKKGFKEYIVTETGDSIVISYNRKKKKLSQYMFKDGYFDGQAYTYYDNGKIQYNIQYSKGYKHGKVKWFFESGKLYRETQYDMGERTGIQKKYYKSGALLAEIPYKDDKVQAGLKEYNEDGTRNHDTPQIKVKEIDKTVFENKVILEFYLEPKAYKIKYFIIETRNGKEYEYSLKKQTKKKKAYLEYNVNPGDIKIEKVKIKAEAKTKLGNPIVLYKTYKLVAENKM
jgi:antitoxin component YwqK of YwqJK toxin-antitoxin module